MSKATLCLALLYHSDVVLTSNGFNKKSRLKNGVQKILSVRQLRPVNQPSDIHNECGKGVRNNQFINLVKMISV